MPIETFALAPLTVGDKTVSAVVSVETSEAPPPPPPPDPPPASTAAPRGHIFGLEANKNTAALADALTIAPGEATSEGAAPILLTLASATGKTIAATYAAGGTPETPTGGRFDADVSDGTWHLFLIGDGTVAGVGFSKSLDPTGAPHYPAGFKFRRITSRVREAGAFVPVTQLGDQHTLDTPKEFAAQSNPGAGQAALLSLGIPEGVCMEGQFALSVYTTSATARSVLVTSPLAPDVPATGTRFSIRTLTTSGSRQPIEGSRLTDTNGNIRFRLEASDGGIAVNRTTFGWKDARGRYL